MIKQMKLKRYATQ